MTPLPPGTRDAYPRVPYPLGATAQHALDFYTSHQRRRAPFLVLADLPIYHARFCGRTLAAACAIEFDVYLLHRELGHCGTRRSVRSVAISVSTRPDTSRTPAPIPPRDVLMGLLGTATRCGALTSFMQDLEEIGRRRCSGLPFIRTSLSTVAAPSFGHAHAPLRLPSKNLYDPYLKGPRKQSAVAVAFLPIFWLGFVLARRSLKSFAPRTVRLRSHAPSFTQLRRCFIAHCPPPNRAFVRNPSVDGLRSIHRKPPHLPLCPCTHPYTSQNSQSTARASILPTINTTTPCLEHIPESTPFSMFNSTFLPTSSERKEGRHRRTSASSMPEARSPTIS
ncbi:hypothetical protein C8R45DRAFT_1114076 [Mycena sanguinolenta]|nr:hypothetical protein C8R45DRAFT_1114076 [Mycena sanguinolenta]